MWEGGGERGGQAKGAPEWRSARPDNESKLADVEKPHPHCGWGSLLKKGGLVLSHIFQSWLLSWRSVQCCSLSESFLNETLLR